MDLSHTKIVLIRIKNYLRISLTELKNNISAHRLALIIFPLLAAIFLHDVLFSNKSLSAFDITLGQKSFQSEFKFNGIHEPVLSDSPYAHYPERKLNWELLKQGHNFNFTPYIFSGTSYIGRKIGAFVTSFPQLFLDTPAAMDWSTWLRMAVAGFFMYLLLVNIGVKLLPAIFAGILWTYNLHQIVWLEFPQHLAAQLWMPLLLLINIKLIKSKDNFPTAIILGLLLVNILFFTSGYGQIALYYYFFIGLFNTLYIGFDRAKPVKDRIIKWLIVNGVFLAAAVLLAADILSEFHDIKLGLRGSQEFRERHTELQFAFSTIFEFFRNITPDINELKRFFSADYLGGIWGENYNRELDGNIVGGGTYFGVFALFLSIYSITGHRRLKDKSLYYVLLFLFFFLVGFYNTDPVVMAIYKLIPFGGSGSYNRILTILIFLLCIFAAFGLSNLMHDIAEKKYLKILSAVLIFAALPVIARIYDSEFFIRKFAYAYIVLAITVAGIGIIIATKRKNLIPYFILLVTVVDLFAVTYDFNTRMRNSRIFPENETIKYLLNDPETFRVAVFATTPIYHPNILTYYSIPTIGGYLTIAPTNYFNFIADLYGKTRVTLNGILYLFKGGNIDVLRQMNVKYILSDDKLETDKAELVMTSNDLYVYRIVKSLQRVYCASDYIKEPQAKKITPAIIDALKRFDRPVVASDLPVKEGILADACSVSELNTYINKLEFKVSTPERSIVLIPYSHNDFWGAKIDDKSTRIYRVNRQLMAIVIDAGNHHVSLQHRNPYELTSAVIKIVFAIFAITLLLMRSRAGILPLTLIIVFTVMIIKNSFSLPGIKNVDILEKTLSSKTTSQQKTPGIN